MPPNNGHRWFAAFWDWQTRHEPPKIRQWRDQIAGGARGRLLEIGCGGGANFPHYGTAASEVIATEPDHFMLERARRRASALDRAIEVFKAAAENLPFGDASFDTVISTANMCSVANPANALVEIRRVLRPGGEYRFFDHVRYQNPVGSRLQDLVTPLWTWFGAGCHPNRNVEQLILAAGLEITEIDRVKPVPPVPPMIIVRPCIKGVAIRS